LENHFFEKDSSSRQVSLKSLWRIILILFGVSAIFLCVGIYTAVGTKEFKTHAILAPGTVIDNVQGMSSGEIFYYPKIHFLSKEGKEITIISAMGASSAEFQVGEAVTLLYDPQRPMQAKIDSFWQLWSLPLFPCGGGVISASIGFGMLGLGVRRKRTTNWEPQFGQSTSG
jgi:Protein of unknown function (DUF3592)